ncbi:TPR domain protein, partial [Byssothecium circinans]
METKQDSRHLVEMRKSTGKGLGIFAIADIPRGTRVIAEAALLKIDRNNTDARNILYAFESLSASQQGSYLELHGFACAAFRHAAEQEMGRSWQEMPELQRRVLAIFAANAFGDVFLLGSRINHSCIPNIHFAYNSILEKETFHAVRDITAGEELTISYNNGVNRTKSQRQAELDNWGFICTCAACEITAEGKEREAKRVQLFSLDQELAINMRIRTSESWKKALKLAQNLAAVQKSEGLLCRDLSVSYYDAARSCVMLGQTRMALLWAEKELEVDRYCVGEDHPDYATELDMVQKLREAVESSKPVDASVTEWFDLQSSSGDPCAI